MPDMDTDLGGTAMPGRFPAGGARSIEEPGDPLYAPIDIHRMIFHRSTHDAHEIELTSQGVLNAENVGLIHPCPGLEVSDLQGAVKKTSPL